MEEFEIACEQHKTIIPIAYPGMVSEIIWEKVKGELTRYPYLEGRIDLLTSVQSPEFLSQIIIHILDSCARIYVKIQLIYRVNFLIAIILCNLQEG